MLLTFKQLSREIYDILVRNPDDLRTDEIVYRLCSCLLNYSKSRYLNAQQRRFGKSVYVHQRCMRRIILYIRFSRLSVRDSPVRRYAALQCYVQAYITSYAAQESQSRRVPRVLVDHAFIGCLWHWDS